MKDKCSCQLIATYHSKLNTWTIEIKYKDYDHPSTLVDAHATNQKAAMTNDIKMKIIT